MLGQGEDDRLPAGSGANFARKAYLRSVSWSDRSPTKPIPKTQPNSKARSCLPPLQPLSIARRPVEEWPKAGSDDLGVWPNPQTPRASIEPIKNCNVELPPVREFEFKKDKLAFFDKECSRIVDHIYLGSDVVAKNREILRQNGITHVLNCVGFVCPEYFKNDLVYKTLWLQDSPSEDITSILYDVFDYFEEVQELGGRVLVHCCQGVSRSTSLVIAYLMWREGQSFEDAFQYVKAARGVTNPNMGFACQLLQCQKRVHAVPASPNSLLRMYRMAPHSSYDPLHLVPKMLSQPGMQGLDSRGAFIVHVPTAIFVWIGMNCDSAMSNQANVAASQFIRYEHFQGPILSVNEGEESSEFWDALADASGNDYSACRMESQRKVDDYDLDFELFHKALAGGLVPPSVSTAGSVTCLPARESGWTKLRQKFASDRMRDFVSSSRQNSGVSLSADVSDVIRDTCDELKEHLVPSSPPFASPCDSPHSFDCYLDGSPDRIVNATKEEENSASCDPSLPPLPPRSPDSFPWSPEVNRKFDSKSPTLSPSTSDYSSSSFAFSPSSSNWSDLSYLSSRQPSPSSLETMDPFLAKSVPLADNFCLHCKEASLPQKDLISPNYSPVKENTCLPCKGSSPSIAERRGSIPPPRMVVPSVDESSQAPRNLVRSWSFSLPELDGDDYMKDVDVDDEPQEDESCKEECMLDVDSGSENEIDEVKNCSISSYLLTRKIEEIEEVTTPVLYQWPTMHKIAIDCFSVLDSRSVYFLLAPDLHLQSTNEGVLYVWLGEKFVCDEELIGSKEGKDVHHHWEAIGRNFLNQVDSRSDAAVQIIREGEEPEPFLNILNSFSFQKAERQSNS